MKQDSQSASNSSPLHYQSTKMIPISLTTGRTTSQTSHAGLIKPSSNKFISIADFTPIDNVLIKNKLTNKVLN